MLQKFRIFTRVRVSGYRIYFMENMKGIYVDNKGSFFGIVQGTYGQLFNTEDITQYSIYILNRKGKVIGRVAWVSEQYITQLPHQDREKAEELVEEYLLRRAK